MTLNLKVILSSTRPGRVGATVAEWFHGVAAVHGGFEVELLDLGAIELPMYNEPRHPALGQYEHEHTKQWAASIAAADAFVLVIPEYNSGTTPALVNALNYVYREWNYKPAAFVSYGGISGGVRAVQFTRQILNTLKVVPILEGVIIPMVAQQIDEQKRFKPTEVHQTSAKTMLDELARWAGALRPLRGAS